MTVGDLVKNDVILVCQVVSVITEGLPQVFGANLVGGQVCTFCVHLFTFFYKL